MDDREPVALAEAEQELGHRPSAVGQITARAERKREHQAQLRARR
jgi:hypothetical protein